MFWPMFQLIRGRVTRVCHFTVTLNVRLWGWVEWHWSFSTALDVAVDFPLLVSAARRRSENCCGCLIAERLKPFTVHAGFIDVLQCGPVQMWNIPVSAAGLALLEMFKVFQSESSYCLGEKKAVAVLDSELFFFFLKKRKTPVESSTHQDGAIFCRSAFVICAKIIVFGCALADMLAKKKTKQHL